MITIYEVYDPDHSGGRVLFDNKYHALTYRLGIEDEYGSASNVVQHDFPDTVALIAFLDSNYRERRPISPGALDGLESAD